MEVKEILKTLLPDELNNIKTTIDVIINELGLKTTTNKRYLLRDNKVLCPVCNNANVIRNGTKNKTQRYKCKNCNKYFCITTNNIIKHTKLNYNQLLKILECMARFETLEITSKEAGISQRQAYNIRIKIISLFKTINEKEMLYGVVQADEKYLRISFKGTRKANMPRKTRRNGNGLFEHYGSGISKKHHMCIVGATDENDNIILRVVGNGLASNQMIDKALKNKIEKGSVLVTDSKKEYKTLAKNSELILKQIPAGDCKIENYHLGELNELFFELEILLLKFRGLSTRHLQEYLDWFRYRKILKYTIEYLEITNNIFKYVLKEKSYLTNKEVCKQRMPFDVEETYETTFK